MASPHLDESVRTFFVPGRVNLIGEHTDYNAGLALPFAIDRGVTVSVRATSSDVVEVRADGYGHWRADEPATDSWSVRALAVLTEIPARSLTLDVTTDLPTGSGLSSSAAYLGALALSLGAPGDLDDVARLVQRCEAASGSRVGLLDPLATLGPLARHALLIDFATGALRDVSVPASLRFTVLDSGVRRELASSQYALRRGQCDAVAAHLGAWPDLDRGDLVRLDDPVLRRRARHVLSENERVRQMMAALEADDVVTVGQLVSASHRSLRDDFEVSTELIDELVRTLESQPGVRGARMIGGGFGGCVLVVHDPDVAPHVAGFTSFEVHATDGAFARLGRPRRA